MVSATALHPLVYWVDIISLNEFDVFFDNFYKLLCIVSLLHCPLKNLNFGYMQKGFLSKVRRQTDAAEASNGVESAPKADVSIPIKKERKYVFSLSNDVKC